MTRGHARISKQNNSSSQKNGLFHNQLLPITHRPLARLPWVNIIKAPGKEGRAPQGDDTRVKSTGRCARTHSGRHTSICGRGAPPDLLLSLPFCLVSVKASVAPLPSLRTERRAFAETPSINYAAGAVHARRGTEPRAHAGRRLSLRSQQGK